MEKIYPAELGHEGSYGEVDPLNEIREAVNEIQSLDLSDHVKVYENIHEKLEKVLSSLDGI